MTQEEIEAIAQRPTCCKTFGESVTISRAERDALVAMARDGRRYACIRDGGLDAVQVFVENWDESTNPPMWRNVPASELDDVLDAAMAKEGA